MCGIAGFFTPDASRSHEALADLVTRMNDSLRHRGPESGDAWVDAASGIALAHRRLAIIDVTPAGAQPMVGGQGRYVISYNGEIYNYKELAAELRANGHTISGGSDTAVLLAALATWGVERTLRNLNGIFAFALWDKQERRLVLARDRLGVKPLYWALADSQLIFGSELKALLEHPACPRTVDKHALAQYFRSGNVPSPYCIFAGVHKLAPATFLTYAPGQEPVLTRYWDMNHIALSTPQTSEDFATATDTLDELLKAAVKSQMVADVPLGALLSGGIDSTLVTALMQAQNPQPVKSFSIGFEYGDFDEAPYAKAVAAHLGTEHTEAYVTATEAQDVIPLLPEIYDEPFADSSQIPTFLVSQMARRQVTVALSGDGGDEGFLGYNRYRAWESLERYPPLAIAGAVFMAGLMPAERWNKLGAHLPSRLRVPQLGDKLVKLAMLGGSDVADVYRNLTSWWPETDHLVTGIAPLPPVLSYPVPDDPVAAMQLWDTLGYLPDDVLTKVDRASMAVALEVRVPLLDHRVIEYAWSLPRQFKLQGGVTKRILRAVLDKYVPRPLLERPKSGFGVPLAAWLRGPLRDWAEALLAERRLLDAGLDPVPIRAVWMAHLVERSNHQHQLWTVLMYLSWRNHWRIND